LVIPLYCTSLICEKRCRGSTLTKAEIEIATNLVNGKWHAYSNSEHEQIGQVAVGLAPQKVQARELLGDKGIVDVTILLGWFTGVSLTLAAYDVPSHATVSSHSQTTAQSRRTADHNNQHNQDKEQRQ
jgi:hypothetical protein